MLRIGAIVGSFLLFGSAALAKNLAREATEIASTKEIEFILERFESAERDPGSFDAWRQANLSRANDTAANRMTQAFGTESIPTAVRIEADMRLYLSSGRTFQEMARGARACMQKPLTSEQVCDCLTAFPGDQGFGPGAGDMILRGSSSNGVRACEAALARNQYPPEVRARLSAQLARAAAYSARTGFYWDNGPFKARGRDLWKVATDNANAAISAGYRRAQVAKVVLAFHDLSGGGFYIPKAEYVQETAAPLKTEFPADYLMFADYTKFQVQAFNVTGNALRFFYSGVDPDAEAAAQLKFYQEIEAARRSGH